MYNDSKHPCIYPFINIWRYRIRFQQSPHGTQPVFKFTMKWKIIRMLFSSLKSIKILLEYFDTVRLIYMIFLLEFLPSDNSLFLNSSPYQYHLQLSFLIDIIWCILFLRFMSILIKIIFTIWGRNICWTADILFWIFAQWQLTLSRPHQYHYNYFSYLALFDVF